jgi:hypothetical protein
VAIIRDAVELSIIIIFAHQLKQRAEEERRTSLDILCVSPKCWLLAHCCKGTRLGGGSFELSLSLSLSRCRVSVCARVIYSHAIDPCSAASTTSFETISLNFTPARGEINFSYQNTNRTTTSAHQPMFMVTHF